jgi:hypothetical protein
MLYLELSEMRHRDKRDNWCFHHFFVVQDLDNKHLIRCSNAGLALEEARKIMIAENDSLMLCPGRAESGFAIIGKKKIINTESLTDGAIKRASSADGLIIYSENL